MKATQGFSPRFVGAFQEAVPCLAEGLVSGSSLQRMISHLDHCVKERAATTALWIHVWLCACGVETQTILGSHLVGMLVEARMVQHALQVFDRLPIHDEPSWNFLISGLAKCGLNKHALSLYGGRRSIGTVCLNSHTTVALLQACANLKHLESGLQIHAEITSMGLLEQDLYVCSALVGMYVACALLARAEAVFDGVPNRDIVLWTSIIAGYVEHGRHEKALSCLQQMKQEGISPDSHAYACSLKACGTVGLLGKGQEIHVEVERNGTLNRNVCVGTAVVDMYTKCGLLVKAHEVFDTLPKDDVVLWNALITGFVDKGHNEAAMECFKEMEFHDVAPNHVTFVCSLTACAKLQASDKGQKIHAEVSRKGLLEVHLLLGSTLVDMYTMCGLLDNAHEVFMELSIRDTVTWNSLIVGFAEHGRDEEALACLEQMHLDGMPLDDVTYASTLKVCGNLGFANKGQRIHFEIVREGILDIHLHVGNSLINMYVECGLMSRAHQVFEDLQERDVVSWNVLITGYTEHGYGPEALECFVRMQFEGVRPDEITFVSSLKACSTTGAIEKGQEVHCEAERRGLVMQDLSIASTLVDMYVKCRSLVKAQEVFNQFPGGDVVLWNTLISGFVEHGHNDMALIIFEQMQHAGCLPSVVSVIGILKACGNMGATDRGQVIHSEISRRGLIEKEPLVGNTLVVTYAKCGSILMAQQVFDELPVLDTASWNALITGYAVLGQSESVFQVMGKMVGSGRNPDTLTFMAILSVCGRACLSEKCQGYFESMSKDYGIAPSIEHHACMIDVISRAGDMVEAVAIIKKMPLRSDLVVWHTVLGACKKWGNVELGRQAFEQVVRLNENDGPAYALMSQILSS